MKIVFVLNLIMITAVCSAQDLSKKSYQELFNSSMEEFTKGTHIKAQPYLEEAQNRAKTEYGTQDTIYATFTGYLGLMHSKVGDYPLALKLYQQALDIYKNVYGKGHYKYIQTLSNLANLYTSIGKYAKAKTLFKESIQLCIDYKKEETPNYPTALNSLSYVYYNLGEYESCIPLLIKSAEVWKKIGGTTHSEYAKGLYNIASIYQKMNDYEEAEPLLLEAGEIWKKTLGDKHPNYASFLDGLASLYKNLGKYTAAESLYLEAFAIRKEKLGELDPSCTLSLSNLANLYRVMKKTKKAENLFLQTLKRIEQKVGKQHINYASQLSNLATLYEKNKEYSKAEPMYKEAQKITKETVGTQSSKYQVYSNNLANIYNLTKQYNKAEALYLEALNNKSIKENFTTLSNLGYLYTFMGRYEEALQLLHKSLITNAQDSTLTPQNLQKDLLVLTKKDFQSKNIAILTLKNIHILSQIQYDSTNQKNRVNLKYGYTALEVAMILNDNTRNNLSTSSESPRLLKQLSSLIEKSIDRGILLETKEYMLNSFNHAEKNKSILLADAIKGNRARTLGDLPDSLVYQEIKLQKEQQNLAVQAAKAKDEATKLSIIKKQNDLSLELDVFLKLLKDKYPQYHAIKYENITAKAEEIQALLDEQTTLLEYFVADSASYLFALSKDKINLYKIPITRKTLKKEVEKLRKALTDYQFILNKEAKAFTIFTDKSYWFYENYLKTALAEHQANKLIIVADAELGYLPFETFLTQAVKTQKVDYNNLAYLINDYKISYNYSATLWKENLNSPKPVNNSKVLACAASYSATDTSLLNIRKPDIFNNRAHLQPLPAAQTEITTLAEYFQGDFLYGDSTNEAFFKENAQNYGVIHLAMHGIVHSRVPMLSSLAFTENGDSLEDNFLQAYEISKLKLNADLVILSACETGYGKFEQGEGVVSLARSFMYAGVPSLVMSLWQVNDNSTARIMKDMYHYLAQGMSKDEALRKAKLNYIKNARGTIAHPAFWSPFVQLGDSRPIAIATKGGNYMLWIGIGLGALAFVFGLGVLGKKAEWF